MTDFSGIGVTEQLKSWEMRATDTRPAVGTGWPGIDSLLHRGGLSPGHLAVIAGRTHTRKTTVALNIVTNLLRADVPVGLVALDEPVASYVGKLASANSTPRLLVASASRGAIVPTSTTSLRGSTWPSLTVESDREWSSSTTSR